MPGGRGKGLIEREQWRSKGFRQGDVGCVVGRDIVTQFPYSGQQQIMGITGQVEVCEVFKRLEASRWIELAAQGVTAKDLRNFEIEQVERVKRLVLGEQPTGDLRSGGCVESTSSRADASTTITGSLARL